MTEEQVRTIVRQELAKMGGQGSALPGTITVNAVLCTKNAAGQVKPVELDPHSGGIRVHLPTSKQRPFVISTAGTPYPPSTY